MKKLSAAAQAKRRKTLLAACEAARQRCNKLSEAEQQKLLEEGLRIIWLPMQKPKLVAVDSNILLALAEEDNDTIDAWEMIRTRLRPVLLIVPPTVLDEVGYKAADPG